MATKKKAAVKKAPAKAKKPAAKKKAAPAVKKAPGIKARMSKSAMVSEIATKTALSKKQVDSVLGELEDLIERHMRKRSAGEFVLPGLLKIKTAKRPASKKRMGRNPATGEEMIIAAKPASMRVKVTPLKKLKDMIL